MHCQPRSGVLNTAQTFGEVSANPSDGNLLKVSHTAGFICFTGYFPRLHTANNQFTGALSIIRIPFPGKSQPAELFLSLGLYAAVEFPHIRRCDADVLWR